MVFKTILVTLLFVFLVVGAGYELGRLVSDDKPERLIAWCQCMRDLPKDKCDWAKHKEFTSDMCGERR
jgi:hypothetical protein